MNRLGCDYIARAARSHQRDDGREATKRGLWLGELPRQPQGRMHAGPSGGTSGCRSSASGRCQAGVESRGWKAHRKHDGRVGRKGKDRHLLGLFYMHYVARFRCNPVMEAFLSLLFYR